MAFCQVKNWNVNHEKISSASADKSFDDRIQIKGLRCNTFNWTSSSFQNTVETNLSIYSFLSEWPHLPAFQWELFTGGPTLIHVICIVHLYS